MLLKAFVNAILPVNDGPIKKYYKIFWDELK